MRGKITETIQQKAREVLGIEDMTQQELRLMPYIQYCVMNDQNLDPNKIGKEERGILSQWRAKGWVRGGASDLSITKEFWDGINAILWLGYVGY